MPDTKLSILQWNCNGIVAHQEEFKNHLNSNKNKYDVICLQETFLKPGKTFAVAGYNSVRLDRTDDNKGGVLTLIKDGLKYTQLVNTTTLECISIKVKLKSQHITVINTYIPPNKEFDKDGFSNILGSKTIIIGDLNAKSKLWGSPVCDERGKILEELIDLHKAAVINTGQPTYQHHNGTRSHLDVAIVSNELATQSNWTVLNNTMGSDHSPTLVTINDKEPFVEHLGPPRFRLSKADWRHFKSICNESMTAGASLGDAIDAQNDHITEAIISAAERCIPQSKPGRRRCKHTPLPYWDDNCKTAIYARNRARNKLNNKRNPENVENYRKLKGIAQRTIKEAASNYWKTYCGTLNRTSNLSAVWNMAKKMNGVASHQKTSSIIHQDKIVDCDADKANIFAASFAEISSERNYSSSFRHYKNLKEYNSDDVEVKNSGLDKNANILNDVFNLDELRRAIRGAKQHSTPGDDRISYEMLQHLSKHSSKSLLNMYNRAWTNGTIPQAWRHSITVPILKAGKDQSNISSYRPISLTSTIGKVMERLVTNRLTYYVEKQDLLTNVQTGFRKGKSTIDQVIRLQDTINKFNNNRGYTVAVFIDFQSAYDMLWRKGLLTKLSKMGISGNVFNYIREFLTNRTMQVRIGNELSDTYTLENGTPQGSVISPLLFLIMINDLPNEIKQTETTLFADDSCVFKSGKTLDVIVRKIQDSLNKLSHWCDVNGFKISMEKTVAVLFTHRKDTIENLLKINGHVLRVDNKAKFLGIIFDSRLTWTHHVDYVVEKCKKRINLLRAVSGNNWGANKKTLLVLYRSLIRSVLDYGDIALDSMSQQNKQRLDSVQAQALRVICGAVRGTATAALQVDTGEPPLQLRRLQHQLQYAIKVKCMDNHPAKSVFQPHWTTRIKKYDSHSVPIYNKVNEFMTQQVSSVQQNSTSLLSVPPWRRKEVLVDISVSEAGSKGQCPHILISSAREQLDMYAKDLQIYTDASKSADGRTAAAFCVPTANVEHAVRLSDDLTIFTGELTAIKLSLVWIKQNSDVNRLGREIAIFSDSLSVLKAINADNNACRSLLLNEIYDLINNIEANVKLIWIPSHLGIAGNETADRLAKSAINATTVEHEVSSELAEVNVKVTKYILEKWQDMWTTSKHGQFYHKIQPTVSTSIKYSNPIRAKEVTVTRLRLGKCCLNQYLATIHAIDNDKCSECKTAIETVEHFLLDCPCSELATKIRHACGRLEIQPRIENILSNENIIDVIYSNIKRKL